MAIDITFILSRCDPDIPSVFARMEQELFALGLWHDRNVIVSDSDLNADRVGEETLIVESLTAETDRLAEWKSIYLEFVSQRFSLGVQFDRHDHEFSSGQIFVDRQRMYRIHKEKDFGEFYNIIGIMASAAGAMGGYAGFEAEQSTLPSDRVLAELTKSPSSKEQWFDIHFMRKENLANSDVESAWKETFDRIERQGYVFFISREYLELCAEFG